MMLRCCVVIAMCVVTAVQSGRAGETLPPLIGGKAPADFESMWAGFDPRAEPLDIEVLKEWEQDGVVLKVLRYRIGVFKGQKAMMAAVYGYPKGAKKVPGLVQIHGGGQYAHYNACLTNAKRGYATISIAWAGRLSAPDYNVSPPIVKLFWDGKTDDPKYLVTTDWGALDAYHAPCRHAATAFASVSPQPWTLDAVDSPRNNPWFLVTLGARRALTFLERQSEVDADRLGVYGHSMGGKLTVLTAAADTRVKAAAPSCGGLSNRRDDDALYEATIADSANLPHVKCPIVFLSPANDFHGTIDDLQTALTEIKSTDWRVTCAPHHNHQDTAEYEVATQLWFDQVLKNAFTWPSTPSATLTLNTSDGVPSFSVTPDPSRKILAVDVYYTQGGLIPTASRTGAYVENSKNQFWHHAAPTKQGNTWTAATPLLSVDKPLWVYANVLYALDNSVTGAGYYYGTYSTDGFNVSSRTSLLTAAQLKVAGVKATLSPTQLIEDFEGDWKKEWFTYSDDPAVWQLSTHKVFDDCYAAPDSARLSVEVLARKPNRLVVRIDDSVAEVTLKGDGQWQRVVLSPGDFKDASGKALAGWAGIKTLKLSDIERLRRDRGEKPVTVGTAWQGAAPAFRDLRWAVGEASTLE